MSWFWLSFAEEDGEGQGKFKGVVLVEADSLLMAIAEANHLGINPGGQVLGFPYNRVPPDKFKNRLLTTEDVAELEGEVHTVKDLKDHLRRKE